MIVRVGKTSDRSIDDVFTHSLRLARHWALRLFTVLIETFCTRVNHGPTGRKQDTHKTTTEMSSESVFRNRATEVDTGQGRFKCNNALRFYRVFSGARALTASTSLYLETDLPSSQFSQSHVDGLGWFATKTFHRHRRDPYIRTGLLLMKHAARDPV